MLRDVYCVPSPLQWPAYVASLTPYPSPVSLMLLLSTGQDTEAEAGIMGQ